MGQCKPEYAEFRKIAAKKISVGIMFGVKLGEKIQKMNANNKPYDGCYITIDLCESTKIKTQASMSVFRLIGDIYEFGGYNVKVNWI